MTTTGIPAQQTGDAASSGPTAKEFAERFFAASLGALDVLSAYLGDRLGWYRSLAQDGPATSTELATRTGTDERYAREWLEQQAVSGVLLVHPRPPGNAAARFELPPGPAEVLTDSSSLSFLGPMARMLAASAVQLPALLDAYRTGGGVSWDQFGADARESQADMNRPWFEQRLGPALAGLPDVHAALSRPGARVLDVGAGGGWSTIALARAYPRARFDGVDVDRPSVDAAAENAAAAGLADRVEFRVADGAGVGVTGDEPLYDVAFAFECVHDMAAPVEVLAAVRRAVRPDGLVIVMDEAVGEEFTAPGDELERLMYGFSLFVCLPDGRSSGPSAATGTVMRPRTLEDYARRAGFGGVEVLPVHDFGFWRFYRLR
jgi:predicted O-methyltransferase YrrM